MGPALLPCMKMSCGVASGLEVEWGSPRLSGGRPLYSEMTGTAVHSLFQLILYFYLIFFLSCPHIRKKHERLCPNVGRDPDPLRPAANCLPTSIPDCPPSQLCPAVDYVIPLMRLLSDASVSTSAPCQPSPLLYLKLSRPNKIVPAVCSPVWSWWSPACGISTAPAGGDWGT